MKVCLDNWLKTAYNPRYIQFPRIIIKRLSRKKNKIKPGWEKVI
jgi:hypothetical protein